MPRKRNEIISAVEIGTRSVKVLIAEILEGNQLNVIGYGEASSHKVEKGEITNPKIVFEQLGLAVDKAEKMAGLPMEHICLALTGEHIQTVNRQGNTPISGKSVNEDDVVMVTRLGRTTSIPAESELIHTLERFYLLDDSRKVQNPVGMVASRLTVDIHIIYGKRNNIMTSQKLVEDYFSQNLYGHMFSGLCTAYGVMNEDDNEKGALAIDIGAGTTEYTLYHGKTPQHSGVITVGTNQICNDLSLGLKLEYNRCQQLLVKYGTAIGQGDGRARLIEIPGLAGQKDRKIPRSTFEQIIELRLRELFEIIHADLERHDVLNLIGNGLILSGGGSKIPQIKQLAKEVFNTPTRIAKLIEINGDEEVINNPAFVTCGGALKIGQVYYTVDRESRKSAVQEFKSEVKKTWRNIKTAFRW
ncbi:MAG: cell division protein FtsA [Lentisphaeraceae bacterium]|nr:cell division protein FtsA [Lentisphaeraceae bacterium]